jgi:hypothetical protein
MKARRGVWIPPALMDRTDGRRGGALGVTLWPRPSSAPSSEPEGPRWLLFHPSPDGVQNMVDPRGSSMAIEPILVFLLPP